jgi:hypothetical protein
VGAAAYWAGLLVRKVVAAATDRGANAANAGFVVALPAVDAKDDGGGRAGSEAGGWAAEDLTPGGPGYDMMNVWSAKTIAGFQETYQKPPQRLMSLLPNWLGRFMNRVDCNNE